MAFLKMKPAARALSDDGKVQPDPTAEVVYADAELAGYVRPFGDGCRVYFGPPPWDSDDTIMVLEARPADVVRSITKARQLGHGGAVCDCPEPKPKAEQPSNEVPTD